MFVQVARHRAATTASELSLDAILLAVPNIYFELTAAFNATQPVVALASGQAVVYYRVAIMSTDGDWVIRETPEACATVLQELDRRGAHDRLAEIAERLLPLAPTAGSPNADAQ